MSHDAPSEAKSHVDVILGLSLQLLRWDPNYADDMEEDDHEEEDEEEEDMWVGITCGHHMTTVGF